MGALRGADRLERGVRAAYLQGYGRRPAWVIAELSWSWVVLSTGFFASDQWGWQPTIVADHAVGHQRDHLARSCAGDRRHGRASS